MGQLLHLKYRETAVARGTKELLFGVLLVRINAMVDWGLTQLLFGDLLVRINATVV